MKNFFQKLKLKRELKKLEDEKLAVQVTQAHMDILMTYVKGGQSVGRLRNIARKLRVSKEFEALLQRAL